MKNNGLCFFIAIFNCMFFLYMYIVDCINICKNGGVVMKGSSGCFCKCFFGLKGSDCFEFDISNGMFKVYCK